MFDRQVTYPTAVASDDDQGIALAVVWCLEQLKGDTLTVWTPLKVNLGYNSTLQQLVTQYRNVDHVTGRGSTSIRRPGPVLMAWADMDDIGKLVRFGATRIRALCVIPASDEAIKPWVSAVKPALLGDTSTWEELVPGLDPVVVEAMKGLTRAINHNNTISAGFEKDRVVGTLLALHDAGVPMDAEAMQGWALANGWAGQNPERLAGYVRDINAGKRPRTRSSVPADYVADLRRRITESV
jgi:hypothetical protein